ncbi:MAG: (2Fe-2S)-binding protein [Vulcanimicrobiaceae bacterium]
MNERTCAVIFEGAALSAREGQSITAALLEAGIAQVFCGMGVCFGCLVVVDGMPNVRACVTEVRDGLRIERQIRAT